MTVRIILAHNATAAWLEQLPELRTSFDNDAEVDAFAERVANAGLQLVVEGPPANEVPA